VATFLGHPVFSNIAGVVEIWLRRIVENLRPLNYTGCTQSWTQVGSIRGLGRVTGQILRNLADRVGSRVSPNFPKFVLKI